jgi:hypothetical protein
VRGSLVEHNRAIGLFVQGSDATIEQTVVRGTLPRASDQRQGRGLHIQLWCDDDDCDPGARANATVRDSLVASSFEAGVLAHGSDLVVEDTFVRDTLPAAADGRYGDGVAVASAWASWTEPATASLTNTAIEQSARAGLGNYGAAVALGGTATACAAFDLDGETYFEHAFSFAVVGENRCGCPAALGECVAASAGLSPPEAVTTDR